MALVTESFLCCHFLETMHELPVVNYNTKNVLFTSPIFSVWFFNHFPSEVRHYQGNVLRIAPEEVTALLLDSAPAHPDAEKLVSADSEVRSMFLPSSTTSIIQPMDFGIIVMQTVLSAEISG